MESILGITSEGLEAALKVKKAYKAHRPLCLPGDSECMLLPENLLNNKVDLQAFEDPLPLAMMATRDPESPMAVAAAIRLSPLGRNTKLISGVFEVVGESTHHPIVRRCVELVRGSHFDPNTISSVQRQAKRYIVRSRKQYTASLYHNLTGLLEGTITPRTFVRDFFELTQAGNMRHQIREKLVASLLLSERIRPSIKFLMLENFDKLPGPVRMALVVRIFKAPPSRHVDLLKDELKWMAQHEKRSIGVH